MFDYLYGEVVENHDSFIILENYGIGYRLFVSRFSAQKLKSKEKHRVFVFIQWLQDAYTLYGFCTHEERDFFELLIRVNGVGPKLAIRILCQRHYFELADAIVSQKKEVLKTISGVGAKTIDRLFLDLSDKVSKFLNHHELSYPYSQIMELESALKNLGFEEYKIQIVLDFIKKEYANYKDMSIEDLLKLALKQIKL